MKLTSWLFSATLLSLSGGLQAGESETTRDYAWAGEVNTVTSAAPFLRIDLPDQVYTETSHVDLRDVRVFNQRGEAMPFALEQATVKESQVLRVPLRFFQLRKQQDEDGEQVFSLRNENGPTMTLRDSREQVLSSWLLEEASGTEHSLSRLKLTWSQMPDNWEARVNISGSNDLNYWRSLKRNMPLMDLTSESGRLLLDEIDLSDENQRAYRYLLLSFDKDGAPAGLSLTAVEGIVESHQQQIPRLSISPDVNVVSSHAVEYSWAQPQPLSQLTIRPATTNSVLPLSVEYRSTRDGQWRPLTRQVFYSVQGQVSEPVTVNGLLIQSVRVKSESTSLREHPPELTGVRDRVTLVFNAQGGAPYLLAWGNQAARALALESDALIPAALRQGHELHQLPLVQAGQPFEVGGVQRLATQETDKAAASDTGPWSKALLWAILIIGVAGLALLAFRVWRELRVSH